VRLVLASANRGKLAELSALLTPLGIDATHQGSYGVGEAPEPHPTFLENALAKARHAARETGLPALADDSGICVNALGGSPGVLSARFAGDPRSDDRNNWHLLEALSGRTDRRAHYYCVLVAVRRPDDPQPLVAEGEWHGEILTAPRGEGGFGYDPLFWLPDLARSAAELDPGTKNRLSHRGRALAALAHRIGGWLEAGA
jgi:XTP/dITP diphosphohydrolase